MSVDVATGAPAAPARWTVPLVASLAWRELRSGFSGFTVFVLCIALGVAAIAGVGSLAGALQAGMERQGRAILGGDITLELVHRQATPQQRALMEKHGRVATQALLRAMARPASGGTPAMVQIKAVDVSYPLYGAVRLVDAEGREVPIQAIGQGNVIAVDPLLLSRLGVKVGDSVRIGSAEARILATVAEEPDKLSDRLQFGPRVLMSQATLQATGLIQPGSLINWRYLVATGSDSAGLASLRDAIEQQFPDAGFTIRDRRDPSPRLRRAIDRFADFLTLVGVTTLLIGGVGVASAISTYLARKRDVIAIFKCLGATGNVIFAIYLLQVLMLAGGGIAAGLAVGASLPALVAALYGHALPIALVLEPQWGALGLAAVYGLVTALMFVLWPLGLARGLKPRLLLRQEVAGERRWPGRLYVAASAACALALGALAVGASQRPLLSLYAVLGIAAVFAFYFGLGLLIERAARGMGRPARADLTLARASLAGPGALVRSVTLALGASLSLLAGIAVVNTSLEAELQRGLPRDAPSYYILDVGQNQRDRLIALVKDNFPEAELRTAPMLRGRIVRLAGVPAEQIKAADEARWVLNGDRGLTYAETLPEGSTLVAGAWWPKDYSGPPLVSFDDEIARGLGLSIGDTVTVNVLGRNVDARIANLRAVDWESLAINFVMVFSPNALAGAPFNLLATIGLPEDIAVEREGRMLRELAEAFPTVTAIRVRDALQVFESIVAQVMTAIRAAASFTLLTGAVVLASALATAQRRRMREAVIYKTLGATRRRIVSAHLIEYALLGLLTGICALALGTLGAYLALKFPMHADFTFSPLAVAEALGLALVLVLVFGAIGTWRALGARPAEQLRSP